MDDKTDNPPVFLTDRRLARLPPEQRPPAVLSISFEGRGTGCGADGCRDFVFGYEAGQLGARLDGRPEQWQGTYHADNMDMLERIADAKGYTVAAEQSGAPGWVFVEFTLRPRVPHLTLVSHAASPE